MAHTPDREIIKTLDIPAPIKGWLLDLLTYAEKAAAVMKHHDDIWQIDGLDGSSFTNQLESLNQSQTDYESHSDILCRFPLCPVAKAEIITAADLAARLNPHIKMGACYQHKITGEIGRVAGLEFIIGSADAYLNMDTGRRTPISGFLSDWTEHE